MNLLNWFFVAYRAKEHMLLPGARHRDRHALTRPNAPLSNFHARLGKSMERGWNFVDISQTRMFILGWRHQEVLVIWMCVR
ncbi:hypothetical protein BDZ45DRAFT_403937 [Acephala macrosclerotiorum]|nr:hypothetical protein BDZ45DRAFT_403937 [Acephala macrosclerotiorum]